MLIACRHCHQTLGDRTGAIFSFLPQGKHGRHYQVMLGVGGAIAITCERCHTDTYVQVPDPQAAPLVGAAANG